MAVYKMKRNKPAQEPPKQEEKAMPEQVSEPAAEKEETPAISRSKNRSLDAYVGSGSRGRRSKENGGSMVDAVYNKKQTVSENLSEDTDRMLLEVFADEKQLRKERKQKEKEAAARRKQLQKERKKQEKLFRKQGIRPPEDEDSYDSLENLYTDEELNLAVKEHPAAQEEPSAPSSVLDRSFFENLLAGEELSDTAEEKTPSESVRAQVREDASGEEDPAADEDMRVVADEPSDEDVRIAADEASDEDVRIVADEASDEDVRIAGEKPSEERELTDLEIFHRIYREDADPETVKAAEEKKEPTRVFDMTGVDTETVRAILEKEVLKGIPEESGAEGSVSVEDVFENPGKEILLKDPRKQEEEFTQRDTAEEMTEGIKDKSVQMLLGALGTFLLTLAALYCSAVCFTDIPRPVFLTPGKLGVVLILVDLELLIAAGAVIRKNLLSGFAALFRRRANADSVTAVGMTVILLYQIVLLLTSATSEKVMLFSAVGCFMAFLSCVQHFMDERRSYRAFRVVASSKDKLVARRLDQESAEFKALKEHLPEKPDLFAVEKTKFADNYFARSRDGGRVSVAYNAAVWMVLAAALVFALYNLSGGLMQVVKSFTVVTLMGLPVCALFVTSMPLSKLGRKCAANESAVIGMGAVEEYSTASVLSFNDTELFPAKRIRISGFRAYGDVPIDRSILYAAMIFKKVGGPLSEVFSSALSGSYGSLDRKFDVLENNGEGICAKIDGREIFVGNKDYMLSYDFGYVNEEMDAAFENSVGRIMYVAVGDRIVAKFYIRYAVNRNFEQVMRRLHKAGICISVKTCDPNLDNELIKCIMKNREYPVCVLKTAGASKEAAVQEKADSGIVCTSSILNMLRTFLDCEKAHRSVGTNLLVKFISLFVGLFVSVLLCFMGRMDSITALFIIGYQLLWLIAVIVPSAVE